MLAVLFKASESSPTPRHCQARRCPAARPPSKTRGPSEACAHRVMAVRRHAQRVPGGHTHKAAPGQAAPGGWHGAARGGQRGVGLGLGGARSPSRTSSRTRGRWRRGPTVAAIARTPRRLQAARPRARRRAGLAGTGDGVNWSPAHVTFIDELDWAALAKSGRLSSSWSTTTSCRRRWRRTARTPVVDTTRTRASTSGRPARRRGGAGRAAERRVDRLVRVAGGGAPRGERPRSHASRR